MTARYAAETMHETLKAEHYLKKPPHSHPPQPKALPATMKKFSAAHRFHALQRIERRVCLTA